MDGSVFFRYLLNAYCKVMDIDRATDIQIKTKNNQNINVKISHSEFKLYVGNLH
jgi:hypothetical protein